MAEIFLNRVKDALSLKRGWLFFLAAIPPVEGKGAATPRSLIVARLIRLLLVGVDGPGAADAAES